MLISVLLVGMKLLQILHFNPKLNWRTDWPGWAFEKVDLPGAGGKDHSSEGGSFDTGKRIVKQVWEMNARIQ